MAYSDQHQSLHPPVPPTLQAFAGELEEYEKLIAADPKRSKTGRKQWRNIGGLPPLTAAEKRKAVLIKTYTFSNDQETLLRVLLFMKEQTDLLKSQAELSASGQSGRQIRYWTQLWMSRAGELCEKAGGWIPEGNTAAEIYGQIEKNNREIEKMIKEKAVRTGVIWMVSLFVLAAVSGLFVIPKFLIPEETKAKETAGQTGTNQTVTIENFTFSIPDYWQESGSKDDYYQYYAEQGGSVAMLSISCPVDNEEVTLEALYADHENMITALETMFPECKVTGYEDFESDYGVKGVLYSYTCAYEIEEWHARYDGAGKYFCFPSIEDSRWFFVALNATYNTKSDYTDDYMKILASIRKNLP